MNRAKLMQCNACIRNAVLEYVRLACVGHAQACKTMQKYANPCKTMQNSKIMGNHGNTCISMELYGYP